MIQITGLFWFDIINYSLIVWWGARALLDFMLFQYNVDN